MVSLLDFNSIGNFANIEETINFKKDLSNILILLILHTKKEHVSSYEKMNEGGIVFFLVMFSNSTGLSFVINYLFIIILIKASDL